MAANEEQLQTLALSRRPLTLYSPNPSLYPSIAHPSPWPKSICLPVDERYHMHVATQQNTHVPGQFVCVPPLRWQRLTSFPVYRLKGGRWEWQPLYSIWQMGPRLAGAAPHKGST